ncbi:MAG TPA: GNAT family N-acetyltransferase [Levilinea sp.]|nr:GNAT family N-acetyltransferase [Levilinea sp.]
MPQIEIRPASTTDLSCFIDLDHGYHTDYVWQMDRAVDEGQMSIQFREIRLPRPVKVDYPYSRQQLASMWSHHPIVLVACLNGYPVGYIHMEEERRPEIGWIRGLAVSKEERRKGIAGGLILAAQEWAIQRDLHRVNIAIQSKNHPAVRLAVKLGYEFCGYQDHYYENRDISLFFSRFLH